MKNLIYFTFALVSLLSLCTINAMEKESTNIQDYDKPRDWIAIVDIFKSDWWSLECNRPYSEALIEQLFEPYTIDPNISKFMQVIRKNDQTIGFITYYLRKLEKEGSVEVMGITTEHRRQHNGQTLLNHAIDEMAKIGSTHIHVHVKKDSEPALALYKKRGFTIEKPAFKGLAYLMKLDLEQKDKQ